VTTGARLTGDAGRVRASLSPLAGSPGPASRMPRAGVLVPDVVALGPPREGRLFSSKENFSVPQGVRSV